MNVDAIEYDQEVEALLVSVGLTVSDIGPATSCQFFGIRSRSALAGVIGIETYGQVGMLRSLAVAESFRNEGYGQALVRFAETWASRRGLVALYLLTTTASGFFARLGYTAVQRTEAPAAIAATPQFAKLCPSSSVFMSKALSQGVTLSEST